MATEKTYEMLWDCRFCGVKKNLGKTHRFCPNCGAPQNPEARYFPADAEKIAVEDHEFVGADVICPACKHPNSKASKNCCDCGSPLDAGAAVKIRHDQVVADGQTFAGETVRDARADFSGETPAGPNGPAPPAPAPKPQGMSTKAKVAIVAVILAIITTILVVIFWRKQVEVKVIGHEWAREIQIETYGPTTESDWCDRMPAGAREISRRKQQRGSESVKDGENCSTRKVDNGDGTFKEKRECTPRMVDKPVMADRCDYSVTKWAPSRSVKTGGSSVADNLTWPTVDIRRPGSCEGCEREGARTARYSVRFSETGVKDEKRCEFDEPRWRSFKIGSVWSVKERNVTGGLACDTIAPAK